jgi:glutathione peroxidase
MISLRLIGLLLAGTAVAAASCSSPTSNPVSPTSNSVSGDLYAFTTTTLEGQPLDLSQYRGQVALVVNTASKCGYTPQYKGLEALYQEFQDQGFVLLGIPSGDFGNQEFASADEIRDFCTERYQVTFPLLAKSVTKPGPNQSPIYGYLGSATGSLPTWNFGKYLVGRDGRAIAYFSNSVKPDASELRQAIQAALAQKS